MIKTNWHGHDKTNRVEDVNGANSQERVLPNPNNKLIEVHLHKFQVEDAQTNNKDEGSKTKNLRNTLASATASLSTGCLLLLCIVALVYRLVFVHYGLFLVIEDPLPMLFADLSGNWLVLLGFWR